MNYADPATYAADVPLSLASAAHAGTSFSPEKRAETTVASYCQGMADTYTMLLTKHCNGQTGLLDQEWATYRAKVRSLELAYLRSRLGLVSTMIAGPSKFPAARMEKRNRVVGKRLDALCDGRTEALSRLIKALHPEWRPVMSGDADAVDRLQEKLAKARKLQEVMKAVNAAMRKSAKQGPDAQVFAMVACGITEKQARELLTPDFCGRLGFPDYAIKNNGAEIRRLESRLEQVTAKQATESTETQGANGVRFEEVPAENRVRVYFPGKPDAGTISKLKAGGFRWAPSMGCWSGYHNYRTVELAKALAGVVGK